MPNMGLPNWNSVPQKSQLLLDSSPNFAQIKSSYLSLLVQPGTFIWHKDMGPPSKQFRYAMSSCSDCVVVVKVHLSRDIDTDKWYADLTPNGKMDIAELTIYNYTGWVSAKGRAVPPMLSANGHGKSVLVEVDPSEKSSLITMAAEAAFPGFTIPLLSDLADDLEVDFGEGGRPTILMDMLRGVLRHCLPSHSVEQIEQILALRKIKPAKFSTCLDDKGNAELAIECMDPGEQDYMRKALEEVMIQKTLAGTYSPGDASSGTKSCRKKSAPLPAELEVFESAQLARYLPKGVPGCVISVETVWDHRVKVSYPKSCPPYTFSACFAEKSSMRDAAKACIAWAWNEHTAKTGKECPYDFEL